MVRNTHMIHASVSPDFKFPACKLAPPTHMPSPAEGRVFSEYQGLEDRGGDVDHISNATYLNNFKDFISRAEPQWDADKKNQLFYQ